MAEDGGVVGWEPESGRRGEEGEGRSFKRSTLALSKARGSSSGAAETSRPDWMESLRVPPVLAMITRHPES